MPVAKIDPVETFYSVGSSLVGRVLLFFAAGWVGMFVGRVASAFDSWGAIMEPVETMGDVLADLTGEILIMVLWPVVAVLSTADDNVFLFFVELIAVGACFYLLVWSEEPVPLWWLVLVAVTSLVPVFGWDGGISWVSVLVLAFFLSGIGALGWWFLLRDHGEVVETVGDFLQGRESEKAPVTQSRKAPKGTWPEGVKGFEKDEG